MGAALIPGIHAPRLVTREMLRSMPRGACFVDISIDQGGITEVSRPTSHKNPVYEEEGVLIYAVGAWGEQRRGDVRHWRIPPCAIPTVFSSCNSFISASLPSGGKHAGGGASHLHRGRLGKGM